MRKSSYYVTFTDTFFHLDLLQPENSVAIATILLENQQLIAITVIRYKRIFDFDHVFGKNLPLDRSQFSIF